MNQLHLLLQHKMKITQTKESNVDLTLAEHLGSLTSCAKGGVDIYKVNCDLSPILDTIKCRWLRVNNILSLGSEETQALVRAMESRVQWVVLVSSWCR